MRGLGNVAVLLAIWILGLIAVVVVVEFGSKVDRLRHAQVVIARLQVEEGALARTGLSAAQLEHARRAINAFLRTLASLDQSDRPARIAALSRRNLRSLEAAGHRPGGVETLERELNRANIADGRAAENARTVAWVGTTLAILFMLIAFSVVFHDAVRARRRSHRDATTDALTGLGNRRKLVADMEPAIQSLGADETMEIGIFDLNGFKATTTRSAILRATCCWPGSAAGSPMRWATPATPTASAATSSSSLRPRTQSACSRRPRRPSASGATGPRSAAPAAPRASRRARHSQTPSASPTGTSTPTSAPLGASVAWHRAGCRRTGPRYRLAS